MEILLTLRKKDMLRKIRSSIDGVIIGSLYAMGFDYSLDDLKQIKAECDEAGLKTFILIDAFIDEDQKMMLYNYMDFLRQLDPEGIIFHDLGVITAARSYSMADKLIYDGQTVLCNSLETSFYLGKGLKSCVISSELTLEETRKIIGFNRGKVSMRIFGRQRLSSSRRNFLSNYFHEIARNYDYLNNPNMYLVEEKRDYRLPVIEDAYGTRIYSDYIFEMYKEILELRDDLKYGIIDTYFVGDQIILQAVRDYRRISYENRFFLKDALAHSFNETFSSGYLYNETQINKDE